jgi:hypothetical protein
VSGSGDGDEDASAGGGAGDSSTFEADFDKFEDGLTPEEPIDPSEYSESVYADAAGPEQTEVLEPGEPTESIELPVAAAAAARHEPLLPLDPIPSASGARPVEPPPTPTRGWWVAPAVILVAIAAFGLIGMALDDDNDASNLATNTTASTRATTTTTSFATTTSVFAIATTPTTDTTAVTVPGPPAAPAACRNSTSPSCGTFAWDPDPGNNAQLQIRASWLPQFPAAGQEVTVEVTVFDPDASPIGQGACGTSTTAIAFGDGGSIPTSCATPCGNPGYGPWTPPPKQRGEEKFSYTHAYAAPGTYAVTLAYASGKCGNPYRSTRSLSFNITVSE